MNQHTGSTHETDKMFSPRFLFFFSLNFHSIFTQYFIILGTRYGSFPFFFVESGFVQNGYSLCVFDLGFWGFGFTQCILVQYDSVLELDSNVLIQRNKIFLDQYVLKFLDFFFRFLYPYFSCIANKFQID